MLSVVLALALALAAPLARQEIPRHDGYVTDLAEILTEAQEVELEELMGSYERGTGHQTAVLTITSLEGRSLEDLSLGVLRGWGIGGAEKNDGALLVVAHEDRRMRFEVGYGLEADLPDIICGRIIRDVIAPEFKQNRYYEGIREGVLAAHAAIGGDYGPLERKSPSAERGVGAFMALAQLLFVLFILFVAGRGRRGGGGGGGFLQAMLLASLFGRSGGSSGWSGGGGGGLGGGGFGGFGGGGGGGGASGGW